MEDTTYVHLFAMYEANARKNTRAVIAHGKALLRACAEDRPLRHYMFHVACVFLNTQDDVHQLSSALPHEDILLIGQKIISYA
jgi:hypothetical protein